MTTHITKEGLLLAIEEQRGLALLDGYKPTQLDNILARAAELSAQDASPKDGWQPIETAPKDETMFLAGWTDGRMCVMRGSILAAQKTRAYPTPEHLQFQCTHWQPLPEPPK